MNAVTARARRGYADELLANRQKEMGLKIYPHEAGRVFVCGEGAYQAEQSSLPGGVDLFAYKKTRHRWQESLPGG